MPLPQEIQELIDSLNEQEPFELNSSNLSPHIMVKTSCEWLGMALQRAESNPRLLDHPDETAKKLMRLACRFTSLK